LCEAMQHTPFINFAYTHPSPLFFFLIIPPPPISTLFPYTTLFRSLHFSWPSTRMTPPSVFYESCAPARVLPLLPGQHPGGRTTLDRKSTRLNSSHLVISYAVFCLKKKKQKNHLM